MVMGTRSHSTDRESSPRDQEPPHPRNRSKRRKYTAVACAECRRRKLKCIPSETDRRCERCVAKGQATCDYDTVRRENAEPPKSRKNDSETIAALRQDVQSLRDTLERWMSTAGKFNMNMSGVLPPPRVPSISGLMGSVPNLPQNNNSAAPDVSTITSQTPRSESSTVDIALPQRIHPSYPNFNGPQEPRFIGPTRSAYSLEVGERALSRLGIPKYELPPVSGQQTPSGSPPPTSASSHGFFWERCDRTEFSRIVTVYQEEVESLYPCLETAALIQRADEILEMGRLTEDEVQQAIESGRLSIGIKELYLAKLAIATTLVSEGHGKSETTTKLVHPVEQSVLNILKPSRELIDLQLLVALSIYYFYLDEDLLAWRTIALAAREALVMGLHRKTILMQTYQEQTERDLAVRVFWAIYVLDRRWSFGTSLSFALVERDIDPELPEPGEDSPYLQCMVGYGRLCTALWDALIPFGDRSHDGNQDAVTEYLDLKTREWLESIPNDLRLSHPRLGLATVAQPSVLQRLRAMLYLRGNHSRILIYRYYLLGPDRIKSSIRNAWLAVEIAQDSIDVLVHLNESSNIYRRQQAMFNYFLLSALAVLFLAVCNDPETFAVPCKKSLYAAIDLLRYFSKHSLGSRRLWSNVRGIVPRLRRLEMRNADAQKQPYGGEVQATGDAAGIPQPLNVGTAFGARSGSPSAPLSSKSATAPGMPGTSIGLPSEPLGTLDAGGGLLYGNVSQEATTTTTPDFNGNDLISLYETFEQGRIFAPQMDMSNFWANGIYDPSFLSEDREDMQFNWLLQ